MALLCSVLMATLPRTANAGCLGDGAHYRIDGADGFELFFTRSKEPMAWSDVDAVLVTPLFRKAFSLTASNGYSFNYLVARERSEGEDESYRLSGFDKDLKAAELPQSGEPAPRYFFTPDLGSALWYTAGERQFLPAELWRLQDCPD